MSWDFFNERKVVARKAHRCMECAASIEPGQRYSYGAGRCEGELIENKLCLTCRALVDVADRYFGFDDGWPLGLRSYLHEEYGIEDWAGWLVWAQVWRVFS